MYRIQKRNKRRKGEGKGRKDCKPATHACACESTLPTYLVLTCAFFSCLSSCLQVPTRPFQLCLPPLPSSMPRPTLKQEVRQAAAKLRAQERRQRIKKEKQAQETEEDEDGSSSGSSREADGSDDEAASASESAEESGSGSGSDSDASMSEGGSDASEESGSGSDSGSSEEEQAAPRKRAPAAKKPAASKAGQKRVRNDAEDDENDEGLANQADASQSKKSRNSTRVTRKPSAAGDSSGEEEEGTKQRKRAKSSVGVAMAAFSSSSGASINGSRGEPVDPDELSDEWRCSANDAMTFRLVRPSPEKESKTSETPVELLNFHPRYTHQLWDDEEIVGYKRVRALVAFTSGALYTYLHVEYESKCAPETQIADIQTLIGSKLRGGFTTDYEDFKAVSRRSRLMLAACSGVAAN